MEIDLFSFILGAVFTGALFVLIDRLLPFIGGNRRVRELKRRVRELESKLKKKDAYIHKAIEDLKKQHGREVNSG
ncbi:MAG: hypothetical protein Q9P14_13140 [candidate division KSB1 bacterium]|nr:hypothetical protein [candidate division KSB1 bacterium]MDQ7065812.1 hypothetical protein [candidate division KSB1 bacterium]